MQEYKPNSFKYKEEQLKNQQRQKKVIANTATVKKKGTLRKIAEAFVVDDVSSVVTDTVTDGIIPAIQKALYDIVVNTAGIAIYHNKAIPGSTQNVYRNNSSRVTFIGNNTPYNSFSNQSRPQSVIGREPLKKVFDYDEIVFSSRSDAEMILFSMQNILADYKIVKVSDFYDLAGISCEYIAFEYGWSDLKNAGIKRVNGGWTIVLPKPMALD